MLLKTLEGQDFLCVNGVQTLSYTCLNLMQEMADMSAMGIGYFRLSPQNCDMVAVSRCYYDVLSGCLSTEEGCKPVYPKADRIFLFPTVSITIKKDTCGTMVRLLISLLIIALPANALATVSCCADIKPAAKPKDPVMKCRIRKKTPVRYMSGLCLLHSGLILFTGFRSEQYWYTCYRKARIYTVFDQHFFTPPFQASKIRLRFFDFQSLNSN
jgi:hypothetical protein